MTVTTIHDYQLADVYFTILIDFAAKQQSISYSELVNLSKLRYGNMPQIKKALAYSTGRPLLVISDFCQSINAPDLALLVDAKTTKNQKPEMVKKVLHSIYVHDWTNTKNTYKQFIGTKKQPSTPTNRSQPARKKEAAQRLMKEFYESHKKVLPKDIQKHEAQILQQVIAGKSASDAYQEVMD